MTRHQLAGTGVDEGSGSPLTWRAARARSRSTRSYALSSPSVSTNFTALPGATGWSRLDVVTHVVAGWYEMLGGMVSPVESEPLVDAATYWSTFSTGPPGRHLVQDSRACGEGTSGRPVTSSPSGRSKAWCSTSSCFPTSPRLPVPSSCAGRRSKRWLMRRCREGRPMRTRRPSALAAARPAPVGLGGDPAPSPRLSTTRDRLRHSRLLGPPPQRHARRLVASGQWTSLSAHVGGGTTSPKPKSSAESKSANSSSLITPRCGQVSSPSMKLVSELRLAPPLWRLSTSDRPRCPDLPPSPSSTSS